jgi:hypothetical protein
VKYWTVLRGHRVFFFKTNETGARDNVRVLAFQPFFQSTELLF